MYPACILHLRYVPLKIHHLRYMYMYLMMYLGSIPHVSLMYPRTIADTCIPHVSFMYPLCILHVSFTYPACVPPRRCAYTLQQLQRSSKLMKRATPSGARLQRRRGGAPSAPWAAGQIEQARDTYPECVCGVSREYLVCIQRGSDEASKIHVS